VTIMAQSVTRRLLQLTAALAGLSTGAACTSTSDEAELRIKVLDPAGQRPLAGAIVSMEVGGLYVTNPDPSRGNPSFVYGARTDEQGTLRVPLKTDEIGVHSFVGGYFYGARLVELDQDVGITIFMAPLTSRDPAPAPPTISNERLDPAIVTAGGQFTVSADVATGDPDDPLSEEVIVTCPTQTMSSALDPPSRGIPGKMYPDGFWSRTLVAPNQPGRYDCYLTATTEGCVTGDIKLLVLEVQ
jgi:hypothetical protein